MRSTVAPWNSAVTAASSATGTSEVPAHTTATRPGQRRRRRAPSSVTQRAASWKRAAGWRARHAARCTSAVVRVTSTFWPRAAMRSTMATTCSGVLPAAEHDLGEARAAARGGGRAWRSPGPRRAGSRARSAASSGVTRARPRTASSKRRSSRVRVDPLTVDGADARINYRVCASAAQRPPESPGRDARHFRSRRVPSGSLGRCQGQDASARARRSRGVRRRRRLRPRSHEPTRVRASLVSTS